MSDRLWFLLFGLTALLGGGCAGLLAPVLVLALQDGAAMETGFLLFLLAFVVSGVLLAIHFARQANAVRRHGRASLGGGRWLVFPALAAILMSMVLSLLAHLTLG